MFCFNLNFKQFEQIKNLVVIIHLMDIATFFYVIQYIVYNKHEQT